MNRATPWRLSSICVLGLLLSVWAGLGLANSSPVETVQKATENILAELQKEEDALRGNPAAIRALIDRTLAPYIDFPRMARLVLGKHWREATAQQKADFTREFRSLLVRFYSNALADFLVRKDIPDHIDMTFLPVKANAENKRVTVRTQFEASGYTPVSVNYRLYLTDGQWKVYDVSVEGISLVLNYRTSFADQIREKGLDGLIQALAKNNG